MIERIKKMMNKRGLSPSQFADEIGLKRSSLSHILSGRNNPSLDVVMKIKNRFVDINTDWLLFGTGSETVHIESEKTPDVKKEDTEAQKIAAGQQKISFEVEKRIQPPRSESALPSDLIHKSVSNPESPTSNQAKATRLLIIYDDQTFESFDQR